MFSLQPKHAACNRKKNKKEKEREAGAQKMAQKREQCRVSTARKDTALILPNSSTRQESSACRKSKPASCKRSDKVITVVFPLLLSNSRQAEGHYDSPCQAIVDMIARHD